MKVVFFLQRNFCGNPSFPTGPSDDQIVRMCLSCCTLDTALVGSDMSFGFPTKNSEYGRVILKNKPLYTKFNSLKMTPPTLIIDTLGREQEKIQSFSLMRSMPQKA